MIQQGANTHSWSFIHATCRSCTKYTAVAAGRGLLGAFGNLVLPVLCFFRLHDHFLCTRGNMRRTTAAGSGLLDVLVNGVVESILIIVRTPNHDPKP